MRKLGRSGAMQMRSTEARELGRFLARSILLMLAVLCVGSAQAATPLDDIRAFQIAWREEAAEVELAT